MSRAADCGKLAMFAASLRVRPALRRFCLHNATEGCTEGASVIKRAGGFTTSCVLAASRRAHRRKSEGIVPDTASIVPTQLAAER